MDKVLETERLLLREFRQDDFQFIKEMLQNQTVMYAYEGAFTDEMTVEWFNKQLYRYKNDGVGLWMVIEKSRKSRIGQCGLTFQNINGKNVVEVGYLFAPENWHKGFATEAAKGCIDYAFDVLKCDKVYSIIRENNHPSKHVARNNNLVKVGEILKHYRGVEMSHDIFCIDANQWMDKKYVDAFNSDKKNI